MLTSNDYRAIRTQLSQMGCDSDNLPLASSYYLTCQYLRAHGISCTDATVVKEVLLSHEFNLFLQNLQLTSEFAAEDIPALLDFWQLLSKFELDINPIAYYNFLLPYFVHDQSAFSILGNDHLCQAIALHVMLAIALQYDISSTPCELEMDDFAPWMNSIHPYFSEGFELDMMFEELWRGCFYTTPRTHLYRSRPAIKEYLDYCAKAEISPLAHLRDYEKIYKDAKDFKTYKSHLSYAEADPYFKKYDASLLRVLVGLRSEPPTFLLHALHYVSSSDSPLDDFGFEASFFENELFSAQSNATSQLIMFPTPSFLRRFCSKKAKGIPTTVLISDERECSLLHLEFPNIRFCTPTQLVQEPYHFDSVVIFAHRAQNPPFSQICHMIDDHAPILALVPQTHFTRREYIHSLYENNIIINRIVAIPPNLTQSLPKKKALVYAQKKSRIVVPSFVQLFFASANAAKLIRIQNNEIIFDSSELFQGRTLIQLHDDFSLPAKVDTSQTGSTASIYHFSKEIRIHYTPFANRANKYSAQVCYRSFLNKDGKESTRGKALTPRTEKGFRFSTMAEVMNAIKLYPLRPEVHPIIMKDVLDTFQLRNEPLSLKTLWFCCIGNLQFAVTYKHSALVSLFCTPQNKAISDLIPDQCTAYDFLSALEENETAILPQINLILSVAADNNLIKSNPLKDSSVMTRYTLNPALRKVRHTLSKAAFTPTEELNIVNHFLQSDTQTDLPICVVNSRYLSVAIRLFTGMNVREIAALQWKHLVINTDPSLGQFLVMQHINDEGRPISNAQYSGKRAHRKIPCPDFLGQLLAMRMAYITRTFGHSEEDINEHPIILREEYPASNKKGFVPQFCTAKMLSTQCKAALSTAAIPSNIVRLMEKDTIIEVDLNASLGDIFHSNFRTRANHTCSLTEGELCYITGIKAHRTYDEHYADYSSLLSQLSIRYALDIWTDRYHPLIDACTKELHAKVIQVSSANSDVYLNLCNSYGMECIGHVLPGQEEL